MKTMTTYQNGCGNATPVACIVMDNKESRNNATSLCHNGKCDVSSNCENESQDDKTSPSKIMRFFSTPRKRSGSNVERPHSLIVMGNSSTWNTLSSIRKIGSFKKLKSSVLQGNPGKEDSDNLNDNMPDSDMRKCVPNSAIVKVQTNRYSYSGPIQDLQSTADNPLVSDHSDGEEGDDSFLRNTHRSRSIRRAYGIGRINLLDTDKIQDHQDNTRTVSPVIQEPQICEIVVKDSESNKVIYRRSKSTDNLNFLKKSSFKRKSTSNLTDLRVVNEKQTPQRTTSTSSADSDKTNRNSERRSKRWKSPIRAKDFDRVLKLVSNVTDVTLKKDSPKSEIPFSSEQNQRTRPNSRLHDDYSRRVSSSTENDRRRCVPSRCKQDSAVCRSRVLSSENDSVGTTVLTMDDSSNRISSCELSDSLCLSPPLKDIGPIPNEVFYEDSEGPKSSSQFTCSTAHPVIPARPAVPKPQSLSTENVKCNMNFHCPDRHSTLSLSSMESEERGEGNTAKLGKSPVYFQDSVQAVYYDDTNEDSGISSHSQLSLNLAPSADEKKEEVVTDDHWKKPPVQDEERTDAQKITTRRWGSGKRSRPRPLSDYGQLSIRSFSIPEDSVAVESYQVDCMDDGNESSSRPDEPAAYTVANQRGQKRRPISVIGGVSFYGNNQTEEITDLLTQPVTRPPVPAHQVPPYKAVSARFRPFTFSQSTPIGLDRVGCKRQMRASHGAVDGGTESSALVDDNGSEEDYSYEELCQASPRYLQPGGEQLAINELISDGSMVYAEALWDHVTMDDQELAFKAGDVIQVLEASNKDWWWGRNEDKEAWFPASFVRLRVNQEELAENCGSLQDEEPNAEPGKHRQKMAENKDQMRTNVIQEIMNTERIYIKHLKDICESPLLPRGPDVLDIHGGRPPLLSMWHAPAACVLSTLADMGQDILGRSSELIHSGELTKISKQGKSQQRISFLFDHQLVFCKKDLLRRDMLYYKGRMDMDEVEVLDVEDGRDKDFSINVKNAFKIVNTATEEVHLFCGKKPGDKKKWLEACANERRRVQEDKEMGMEISENQKKQAMQNARKSRHGKMKGVSYSGCPVPPPHQILHPIHQRHITVPTSIPQQQVFALAEPKRKPSLFWHTFNKLTPFKK
ncbi:spermatogenesis-associated protein 13 [Sceloporus undulatus]|uniref:spermatogenesis-associated protein 13 n=1 Tax=Sceloporus undulatus TaxID=8520 RepID=UPI001C4BBA87|nr:spermatogenesis-associated protein 13 [Sceloporus undulatus]